MKTHFNAEVCLQISLCDMIDDLAIDANLLYKTVNKKNLSAYIAP